MPLWHLCLSCSSHLISALTHLAFAAPPDAVGGYTALPDHLCIGVQLYNIWYVQLEAFRSGPCGAWNPGYSAVPHCSTGKTGQHIQLDMLVGGGRVSLVVCCCAKVPGPLVGVVLWAHVIVWWGILQMFPACVMLFSRNEGHRSAQSLGFVAGSFSATVISDICVLVLTAMLSLSAWKQCMHHIAMKCAWMKLQAVML